MVKIILALMAMFSFALQANFVANEAKQAVVIDGKVDTQWQTQKWYPLDKLILGQTPTAEDFNGRFKLLWDAEHLYIMAEIEDDILFDQHANPLHFYWDDDCLEIFLDENFSGGDHQFSYNAFAYHVALDNQAVDIGEKTQKDQTPFVLLNDHVKSQWRRHAEGNKLIWEVAVKIYDDSFSLDGNSKPVTLSAGKVLGFMLAYCDNDGSETRESFIGSTEITPVNGDKNLGYKTASVFEKLTLR